MAEDVSSQCDAGLTTLMFKNIPCRCTQVRLKTILDQEGFQGQFTQIYMPRGMKKNSNHGYGFVNFKTFEAAERCRLKFHQQPLTDSLAAKLCCVEYARHQGGLEAMHASQRRRRRGFPLLADETPLATVTVESQPGPAAEVWSHDRFHYMRPADDDSIRAHVPSASCAQADVAGNSLAVEADHAVWSASAGCMPQLPSHPIGEPIQESLQLRSAHTACPPTLATMSASQSSLREVLDNLGLPDPAGNNLVVGLGSPHSSGLDG